MNRRAQERILIILAALILAFIFLKLTYEVVLTSMAIIQAMVFGTLLFICGYYAAKYYLFKLFKC